MLLASWHRFTAAERRKVLSDPRLASGERTDATYRRLRAAHEVSIALGTQRLGTQRLFFTYSCSFAQWYCTHQQGQNGKWVKRSKPLDAALSGRDGCDVAARSLEWYILQGNPGYKVSVTIPCLQADYKCVNGCIYRTTTCDAGLGQNRVQAQEHLTAVPQHAADCVPPGAG